MKRKIARNIHNPFELFLRLLLNFVQKTDVALELTQMNAFDSIIWVDLKVLFIWMVKFCWGNETWNVNDILTAKLSIQSMDLSEHNDAHTW